MRLAAYRHQGLRRGGVVDGDSILPFPEGVDLLDVVRTGTVPTPQTEVRLLPPVEPPSVRDFVTFEEHVEGVRRSVSGQAGMPGTWYDAPTFSFANPHAMVGAHDDVPVPPGSQVLDFELEVAAVIGRPGRDLTPDHVFG